MALQSLSLLLYAAYVSLQPCETLFTETAKSANPKMNWSAEEPYLREFAKAACQTSNPDVLWLIAQQESNFRFQIIRVNGETPKVLEGDEARALLESMRRNPEANPKNVDIGVLQINWLWHQKGFSQNPELALSPARQVDYFLKEFGVEIERRCDERWVGCYHNQSDPVRSQRYQQAVLKKGKVLALQALYAIRSHRKGLTAEERKVMPAVKKDEFYRVFDSVGGFPLPQKQILHFVDDKNLPKRAPEPDSRLQG